MFARVTTFGGDPEALEQAARTFEEQMIPWMREATGFRAWVVLLDRAHERSLGITFWTSEEAMRDSDASGISLRDAVARSVGNEVLAVDFYEVVAAEGPSLDELR